MADSPLISELPHALEATDRLQDRLSGRVPAVFLDYDGTLTPIVDDPAAATLDDDARTAVRAAADRVPVAVVSGRDLADVRAMVDVEGLAYAGSHGFDMLLADGTSEQYGKEFLDELDTVEQRLRDELVSLDGVGVERKRFAVAVHTRRARDGQTRAAAERRVSAVADDHDRLRVTGGKDITEFRPGIPWDKGRALERLVTVLGLDSADHVPLYVGDDDTDEDAFAVLGETGIGVVVVGDRDRPTSADFRLDRPAETVELLRLLTDSAET